MDKVLFADLVQSLKDGAAITKGTMEPSRSSPQDRFRCAGSRFESAASIICRTYHIHDTPRSKAAGFGGGGQRPRKTREGV